MVSARTIAVVALAALIAPAAIAATIAPPEYRECMKVAVEARERGYIDSFAIFYDEHLLALETRREQYVAAYDSELDSDIRERIRDANREFGRRYADIRSDKRERDRDVTRAYNDAKKECRDIRRAIEHPPKIGSRPIRPRPCFHEPCLEPFPDREYRSI